MKRICLVMTVHYLEVLGSGVSVATGERFVVKRGVARRIAGVRDWPTASKSARFISPNRPHRHSRTQGSTQGAREIEKNESVDWEMSYANARGAGSPSHYSSCHTKTLLTINCRLNAIES